MPYEMNRSDVIAFMSGRGEYREKGDEVEAKYCPYCGGGVSKDTWTFSINSVSGAFCCLRESCGAKGHFVEACRDFGFDLGLENGKMYRQLPQPVGRIVTRDNAVKYLGSRGISEEIAKQYQITVKKDEPNTLVFPFFNADNELVYVKYRNITWQKGSKGSKEWSEKGTMPILFGMQEATQYDKPLIITEGQIDSLSVAEAGIPNAVSVPTGAKGFTWLAPCLEFVNRFSEIIVFGDYEHGKVTLIDTLRSRLPKNRLKCVRKIDYLGEKDANDILRKYGKGAIQKAVEKAEYPTVSAVKDLADVEAVDLNSLDKVETGIRTIDRLLGGGIAYGQLVLLTGKRGDGKSTFLSQMICSVLEQGVHVFAYSGELPDFHFKRWLDLQLTGRDYLKECEDRFGEKFYLIPDEVEEAINSWYKGKVKIFDNQYLPPDGKEMESLPDIIEQSILAYDTRFICIDNLMTAMETVNKQDDLYLAQSNFVGRLKRIAIQYNVVVILVAHPRKSQGGFTNDDVSGSGDITNKADIVMNYGRNTDSDGANSKLLITKNRLTGRLAYDDSAIPLQYSSESKRISGGDRAYRYGWVEFLKDKPFTDYEAHGFYEIQEKLPF